MVAFAPVHPNKQHRCPPLLRHRSVSQRRTCGALMAVLTRHDIPPAVRPLNTGRGTVSPESSQAPCPPSAHRPAAPP
jgi:hypothetical protein